MGVVLIAYTDGRIQSNREKLKTKLSSRVAFLEHLSHLFVRASRINRDLDYVGCEEKCFERVDEKSFVIFPIENFAFFRSMPICQEL